MDNLDNYLASYLGDPNEFLDYGLRNSWTPEDIALAHQHGIDLIGPRQPNSRIGRRLAALRMASNLTRKENYGANS